MNSLQYMQPDFFLQYLSDQLDDAPAGDFSCFHLVNRSVDFTQDKFSSNERFQIIGQSHDYCLISGESMR